MKKITRAHAPKERIVALRAETGAPILDCRKALKDAEGDFQRARELLKERGKAVQASKAERATGQGTVGMYVHHGGRAAALVLLRCETDFVAQSPVFQVLAKDLAMQVVAMNPTVVRVEDVPEGSRPEEAALLAQLSIRDPSGKQTVGEFVAEKVLELGENILVEKFIRFTV